MKTINETVKSILATYYDLVKSLHIAIIAGVDGKSTIYSDYKRQSIKSALWDYEDIEKYITILQNDGAYATAYFNFLDFIKDYVNNSLYVKPNIIFETSSIPSTYKTRDQIVPAFIDLLGIKHLGPNASLNALCNDKYLWNRFFKAHDLPVPETHLFTGNKWISKPGNNKQYILKLNNECTSIGIASDSIFDNVVELTAQAKRLYLEFNQPIIAQEFICGHEVEIPILVNHNRALHLPPIEIISNTGEMLNTKFLNYEWRYNENYTMKRFDIDHAMESLLIRKYINKVVDLCKVDGYMRLDCRVDNKGNIYFFDFNNDPAINRNSSFYASLASIGFVEDDVIRILIGNTLV